MNFIMAYLLVGVFVVIFNLTIGRLFSREFDTGAEYLVNSLVPGMGTAKREEMDAKRDGDIPISLRLKNMLIMMLIWPVGISLFIFCMCLYYGKGLSIKEGKDE